jgi:hypothetical protein
MYVFLDRNTEKRWWLPGGFHSSPHCPGLYKISAMFSKEDLRARLQACNPGYEGGKGWRSMVQGQIQYTIYYINIYIYIYKIYNILAGK